MSNLDSIIDSIGVTPYHRDEYGVLYNADCLTILPKIPDKSVDLVLTDPPYGVGSASGTMGRVRSHKYDYDTHTDTIEYVINYCVPAITRLLSIGQRMILTPGPKALTYYPRPDSFGVFYQPATMGMQLWGRADAQPIFYYGRDPRCGKTIDFCSATLTNGGTKTGHPCAKPLAEWSWLLNRGSLDGDVVLDPFCGSGTTLVAAKQLGRKYIGVEISQKYCDICVERLRQRELF